MAAATLPQERGFGKTRMRLSHRTSFYFCCSLDHAVQQEMGPKGQFTAKHAGPPPHSPLVVNSSFYLWYLLCNSQANVEEDVLCFRLHLHFPHSYPPSPTCSKVFTRQLLDFPGEKKKSAFSWYLWSVDLLPKVKPGYNVMCSRQNTDPSSIC